MLALHPPFTVTRLAISGGKRDPSCVRVALFDPCYLGVLRPSDASHARRVLEALGDEVTLIDGRC